MEWIAVLVLGVLAVPFLIVGGVYVFIPVCKGIGAVLSRIVGFVVGIVGDAARFIGAIVTSVVVGFMCVGSVLIGRWSAAAHYGRALHGEAQTMGGCVYRLLIGRPARLFFLDGLTEGLEKRVPEIVAAAPGADRPRGRSAQFDGYEIVGSLQGGGSGGKLYIARPSPEKLAAFSRRGLGAVGDVVIKVFHLRDGSELPQILRENRAIPAAKRLGLILEHVETADRFYYVMRYVPGESLGLVTQRLHSVAGPAGLDDARLRESLEYAADLLMTLRDYHAGGLWHKDVKPDNIIVSADKRAHLVDFGLITPLASTMTLTTHGTEYFRDPEMVRLALSGAKVSDVDGARFDIYAVGAVLFSMIENSFPAHGGLSRISKKCPESVRWIVRRAMTDYDKRYESAAAMLADVEAALAAADIALLRPIDLPSVRTGGGYEEGVDPAVAAAAAASVEGGFPHSPVRPAVFNAAVPAPAPVGPGKGGRPRLRVVNWWTGKYEVVDGDAPDYSPAGAVASVFAATPAARERAAHIAPHPIPVARVRQVVHAPRIGPVGAATAAEQVRRARERAAAASRRARERMGVHRARYGPGVNAGVVVASMLFVGLILAGVAGLAFLGVRFESPDHLSVPDAAQLPEFTPGEAGGARIMVLRDPVALDAVHHEATARRLETLRTAGFVIAGEDEATTPEEAASREADLRAAIGVSPFASPAAAKAIREWLESADNIELVVWIGRDDQGNAQPWVVAPDESDEHLPRTASAAVMLPAARAR